MSFGSIYIPESAGGVMIIPESMAGDVVLEQGVAMTSLAIRLLQSIRYGVPFKETFSHIEINYDGNQFMSAEPKGIMLVDEEKSLKKKRAIKYRFRNLSAADCDALKKILDEMAGIKYAYARYLLDTFRIWSFFWALTAVVGFAFGLKRGIIYSVCLASVIALSSVWRKIDNKTMDCTEMSSEALFKWGRYVGLCSKLRNEFLNSCKMFLDTAVKYGAADLVATRGVGEPWKWR